MIRSISFLYALFCINICQGQSIDQPLPVSKPEKAGYSPSFFSELGKKMTDSIPSLGAFVVWSHDAIIYENYFHGASAATSFNIKSITKSVVSALAGIAQAKGLLPALDTPVIRFFPEFAAPHRTSPNVWFASDKAWDDSIRQMLRLKDLLSMQTGWDWSDFGQAVNIFINSADPVRFTMDIPFADAPGKKFNYCSAATSLFSAALAKCVKTDLRTFAETNLFEPAGMKIDRWDTDPVGRYVGASEMFMSARSLLRFGLIYLHHGKAGDKQLIPEKWVNVSTQKQAELDFWDVLPGADGYGYFWWRRKTNGHQAFIASGAGGQLITVIPDLGIVVVATCLLNENNRGREEIKRLHLFIDMLTKPSR